MTPRPPADAGDPTGPPGPGGARDAGGPAPGGRPARKTVPLRLDPAVHAALAKWAGDELRSLNAQIEVTLRRALAEAGRLPSGAAPVRGRGRPPRAEAGPDTAEGARR